MDLGALHTWAWSGRSQQIWNHLPSTSLVKPPSAYHRQIEKKVWTRSLIYFVIYSRGPTNRWETGARIETSLLNKHQQGCYCPTWEKEWFLTWLSSHRFCSAMREVGGGCRLYRAIRRRKSLKLGKNWVFSFFPQRVMMLIGIFNGSLAPEKLFRLAMRENDFCGGVCRENNHNNR